jgi:hypothetical protein
MSDGSTDGTDLVQPEGTNAGSDAATAEAARPPAEGDVLAGGDAAAAPDEPDGVDDRDLTGAGPASDEPGGVDPDGQDGQDAGLME